MPARRLHRRATITAVMDLADTLLDWYDAAARTLPWRGPGVTPWAVLVSEVMLQQTPVRRVEPAYDAWLRRWPTPATLAAAPAGDAVRMWGRLGYPRRALRLHECARAIVDRFSGEVPTELADLLGLPGVGPYTARAVATFAFGQRHPVVDTNVRRVAARVVTGRIDAGARSARRDHATVEQLLPAEPDRAARVSVALMEFGALICVARAPRCADCPLADVCAWRRAGHPRVAARGVRTQRFTGTDRQVRGLLLEVLRASSGPVGRGALDAVWSDATQRQRALDALVTDGLAQRLGDGRFALPA